MIDPARVREILSSHGGNDARWPAHERDAALAVVRRDAGLRAERGAALDLDALLDEWAGRDLASGSDAGVAAARVLKPARNWFGWAAGSGAVAAAVLAMLMVGTPKPAGIIATAPVAAAAATPLTDAGAFSTLFTTTPDEDSII